MGTPCLPPHPTHPVSGLRILRQGPWGGSSWGSWGPLCGSHPESGVTCDENKYCLIFACASWFVFVCLFSISASTRYQQYVLHTNQNPSSPLFQEMLVLERMTCPKHSLGCQGTEVHTLGDTHLPLGQVLTPRLQPGFSSQPSSQSSLIPLPDSL